MGSGGAQYRHDSQVLVQTLKMIAQMGLVNQALLPPCLVYSGSKKKVLEQGEKLKRSREQRKMKKEQGKSEKGARGRKMKGAGSKGGNCERSRERGPPLTEAQQTMVLKSAALFTYMDSWAKRCGSACYKMVYYLNYRPECPEVADFFCFCLIHSKYP